MKLFVKFLLAWVLCVAVLQAAGPSPSPSPTPKTSPAEGEFEIPVPEGMPVHGIKVPHRDRNGKLVMVIEADVAKKIDANHIEMQDLKIDSYDDDGKKVFVQVAHSVFDLETRILSGDTHALIKRDDFEITGDTVEFDTRNRNGKMRGNIKMTIQTPDAPQ